MHRRHPYDIVSLQRTSKCNYSTYSGYRKGTQADDGTDADSLPSRSLVFLGGLRSRVPLAKVSIEI